VRDTLEVEILACLYVGERAGLLGDRLEIWVVEIWVGSRAMRGLVFTLWAKEDSKRLKTMMEYMEKWNQEASEGTTEVWVTSGEEAFLQGKAGWEV
jgi:hypothetical protein